MGNNDRTTITLSMSVAEKARLQAVAASNGMTVSAYVASFASKEDVGVDNLYANPLVETFSVVALLDRFVRAVDSCLVFPFDEYCRRFESKYGDGKYDMYNNDDRSHLGGFDRNVGLPAEPFVYMVAFERDDMFRKVKSPSFVEYECNIIEHAKVVTWNGVDYDRKVLSMYGEGSAYGRPVLAVRPMDGFDSILCRMEFVPCDKTGLTKPIPLTSWAFVDLKENKSGWVWDVDTSEFFGRSGGTYEGLAMRVKRAKLRDKKVFAEKMLAKSDFVYLDGKVNRAFRDEIVAAYRACCEAFKRDTDNFTYEDGTLYGKPNEYGVAPWYIRVRGHYSDYGIMYDGKFDKDARLWSADWDVSDDFYRFLADQDEWAFAGGEFDREMAKVIASASEDEG